ncbi:MAG: hypothetical protein P1U46_00605 [Patescibacteria group bacterium]|nr:hypothetical protein [Patescibacteria group bacterium]
MKDITKPYIAADSTSATNKTIKVISLAFNLGFLDIAVTAQAISFHSQIQAHKPASQIASHAQILAVIVISSIPIILNATIRPYIAADSTNAIPSIVTVSKKVDISLFFHIASTEAFHNIH